MKLASDVLSSQSFYKLLNQWFWAIFCWYQHNLVRIKEKIRSSTVTCLLLKLLKEFLKFCHTFFWVFPYCKSNIFVQNGITIFIKSWKNVFNKATFHKILVPSLSNVNNYVVCIYWKYANISRNNAAELTTSILSFWVLASSATLFMHFFLHKYGPQINFFCPMMGEVSQHSFIKHIFIWFEKTFYTMKTEQTKKILRKLKIILMEIFMLTEARLCWNS